MAKKVAVDSSLVTISHYKNLLQAEGIEAFLKNEHLGSIVGEIPFQEVWPQLWVRNNLDYDRAKQLIDSENLLNESPAENWICDGCGEDNEGQFAACWNCSKANQEN